MVSDTLRRLASIACLTPLIAFAAPQRANIEAVESLVLQGTNEFRASENRPRLERNGKLDNAARKFAEHLATGAAFSHESGGTTPEIRVFQAGYTACVVAENLERQYSSAGFGTKDLAQTLLQGWKNSPSHRKNMLEPDALETGLAIVYRSHDGVEDYYAVQLLARNESSTVNFTVVNWSGATISYRVNDKRFSLDNNRARGHGRCSRPDLEFEGQARGRFEPAMSDCFAVMTSGEVERRPPSCRQ